MSPPYWLALLRRIRVVDAARRLQHLVWAVVDPPREKIALVSIHHVDAAAPAAFSAHGEAFVNTTHGIGLDGSFGQADVVDEDEFLHWACYLTQGSECGSLAKVTRPIAKKSEIGPQLNALALWSRVVTWPVSKPVVVEDHFLVVHLVRVVEVSGVSWV